MNSRHDIDRPDYRERIGRDPNVLVGKPTVKGTRVSVELVLEVLSQDLDLEGFFEAYPHLTRDDVQAVLAYARAVVIGEVEPQRPLVEAGGFAER